MNEDKPTNPNPESDVGEVQGLRVKDVDKSQLSPAERAHFEKVYETKPPPFAVTVEDGKLSEESATRIAGDAEAAMEEWLVGEPAIREVPGPGPLFDHDLLEDLNLLQASATASTGGLGTIQEQNDARDDINQAARRLREALDKLDPRPIEPKPVEVGEVVEACAKICEALAKPYADARLETFDFGAKNRLSSLETMAEKCAEEIRKHKVTIEQTFNPISQKVEIETVTIEEINEETTFGPGAYVFCRKRDLFGTVVDSPDDEDPEESEVYVKWDWPVKDDAKPDWVSISDLVDGRTVSR